MSRNGRSSGRRSELELSTLPEVAALATELTLIFNGLGITQQQYAIRTNYDKSYISRFLNGRRVATQDFIDRLLVEIEKQRKSPVTHQTSARLKQLRLNALRAYDPEMYKLESLRAEVDRNQRDIKRLLLHQEALEGLLERRNAEAEELRGELGKLRSDWISDRVQGEAALLLAEGEKRRFADERNELLVEIARLKEELMATIEQKELAEQRCAALEEQVTSTEMEVAEKRDRDDIEDVGEPIEYTLARLQEATENEIYRELSGFSLTRSAADIVELCLWLHYHLGSEYSDHLASDYCKQRPVRLVAQFALHVEESDKFEIGEVGLFTAVARVVARRSLDELFEFCARIAEAHKEREPHVGSVNLTSVTQQWLSWSRRKGSGRSRHLLEIVDHLKAIGEERTAVALIGRLAMFGNKPGTYAQVISESGREYENRIYVESWIRGIKATGSRQFIRQMRQMCDWPNSLMVDMIMADVHKIFDASEVGRILIETFDETGKLHKLGERLIRAVVDHGNEREVLDCIEGMYAHLGKELHYPPAVAQVLARLERFVQSD